MARRLVLLVVIVLQCLYVDGQENCNCQQCPDGWTYFRDSCYLLAQNKKMDWTESSHYCNLHHGAGLVVIESEAENDFLKDMISRLSDKLPYWTAASDGDIEHVWEWYPDNRPVEYSDWGPGEPNMYHGHDEDCMEIRTGYTHMWNDELCSVLRHPLCEVRLNNGNENVYIVGK